MHCHELEVFSSFKATIDAAIKSCELLSLIFKNPTAALSVNKSIGDCPESNDKIEAYEFFRMATIFQRISFEQIKITTQTTRSTCWKELAGPGWS